MRGGRPTGKGWYRTHWKAVVEVWGIFLGMMLAMAAFYWWALSSRPRHVLEHLHPDAHWVEASSDYPLPHCVVSGKPLNQAATRAAVEYDGIEIQFCCPPCLEEFNRDPVRFASLVREARK